MASLKLKWQSKTVLLLVLPAVAANLVLEMHWWIVSDQSVAVWTLGLSALLGLVAWKLRSATPGAALAGAAITASLMFSSARFPFMPWQTMLLPVVAVLVMTALATRLGRRRKEQLGTAEKGQGRVASQVAANLGIAALVGCEMAQNWLGPLTALRIVQTHPALIFSAALAALCEAAADTVSSELGQLLNSRPRMITTLRVMEPGTDGAISLGGTVAGMVAAGVVAAAGALALQGGWLLFAVSSSAGVFGLFFDSLLGATLERRGLLNNDAVNFLSTLSAAGFALVLLTILRGFKAG